MRGPGATCHAGRGGDPRGPHVPAAAGSNGWGGGWLSCLPPGATPADPTFRRPPVRTGGPGLVVVFAAGDPRGPHVPAAAGSNGWAGGWLSCLPPGATPADPTFRRPPVRTGGPGLVGMFAAGGTPADPT